MAKVERFPDIRKFGKVNCIRCGKIHNLSELDKKTEHHVDFYICKETRTLLAISTPDGRITPVIGTSVG